VVELLPVTVSAEAGEALVNAEFVPTNTAL
jgi:hypothetical protein